MVFWNDVLYKKIKVESNIIVGEVLKFDVKLLKFTYLKSEGEEHQAAAEHATKRAINTFKILMSGCRVYPKKKRSRFGKISV